jgi:ABC-type dipeptide/oligopeptide/nickel transport system permease component
MALTLLSGTATVTGVVLADLAYAVVDPRIRRG